MDTQKNLSKLTFSADCREKRELLKESIALKFALQYPRDPNFFQALIPKISEYVSSEEDEAKVLQVGEKYFCLAELSFLSINHSFQRLIRLFQWNSFTQAKWCLETNSAALEQLRIKRKREETEQENEKLELIPPLEFLDSMDFIRFVQEQQFDKIIGNDNCPVSLKLHSDLLFALCRQKVNVPIYRRCLLPLQ